jgi:hypothetical protein
MHKIKTSASVFREYLSSVLVLEPTSAKRDAVPAQLAWRRSQGGRVGSKTRTELKYSRNTEAEH